MSCGEPHEMDCAEVLRHLDEYLDGEVGPHDHDRIATHLHECGACLEQFDVERVVKALVARSCCSLAPDDLRRSVLEHLGRVRAPGTVIVD